MCIKSLSLKLRSSLSSPLKLNVPLAHIMFVGNFFDGRGGGLTAGDGGVTSGVADIPGGPLFGTAGADLEGAGILGGNGNAVLSSSCCIPGGDDPPLPFF